MNVFPFDTTAFYDDLVTVCHSAMGKSWGGQVKYNGWLTFDVKASNGKTNKDAIAELSNL